MEEGSHEGCQCRRRIHAREISPVEATTAQLARIEKLDGQLKSYAHMMAEAALIQARAAEAEITRGEIRGPLHGVPIAVKDLCWTQGVPTAAGMAIYTAYFIALASSVRVSSTRTSTTKKQGRWLLHHHRSQRRPGLPTWQRAGTPGPGGRLAGTFQYTGGTGKYQGITGDNTFVGVTQVNWADGTSSGYATWNR
jgi:amidase